MDTIKYGSTGDTVKTLQSALNRAGYSLKVDGIFGTNTTTAVKDFQSKKGLVVDGIVGPKTWDKLYTMPDAIAIINECVAEIQASDAFKRLMELIEQ